MDEYKEELEKVVELRKNKRKKDGGIEFDTCIVSTKALDNLIKKYNYECETSHHLQSELDKANACIFEHKMKIIGKYGDITLDEILKRNYINKDKARDMIIEIELEVENDGPLTKLNNYDLLRVIVNKLDDMVEES